MPADRVSNDPAFTAYCPECEGVKLLENVAHIVKCQACGEVVLGNEVVDE